mgnify:CR=1 FL=1
MLECYILGVHKLKFFGHAITLFSHSLSHRLHHANTESLYTTLILVQWYVNGALPWIKKLYNKFLFKVFGDVPFFRLHSSFQNMFEKFLGWYFTAHSSLFPSTNSPCKTDEETIAFYLCAKQPHMFNSIFRLVVHCKL